MNFQKNQILVVFVMVGFFCSTTFASSDPCEDLYSAACLNSNGEARYKDKQKNNEKKMQQKVKLARDVAAQRQRFKNFEDMLRTRLEAAGFPLVEGLDLSQLSGDDINMPAISKDASDCRDALQQQGGVNIYAMQSVAEIEQQQTQSLQIADRFQVVRDSYYAKDLPQFITDLNKRCQQLEKSETYEASQNSEMAQTCGRLQSIRSEAIDLFRQEDAADYKQRALDFVNRNKIRRLVPKPPAVPANVPMSNPMMGGYGGMLGGTVSGTVNPFAQMTPEAQAEMQRQMQLQQQRFQEQQQQNLLLGQARGRAESALSDIRGACEEVNAVIRAAAADVITSTLQESSRDRVTIETLIDSVYTPERKAKAEQMFNQARQGVADFVQLNVGDQTKRNTIVSGLDEMQFSWMERPLPEVYISNGRAQVLNMDDPVVAITPSLEVWSNPQLSFFTKTNAFYNPRTSYGNVRIAERVTLQPTVLELMDENPDTVRFVLGHEVGHRLGPRLSEANGYGMSNEYSALLSCYRSSTSIRMQDNQKDEVIADYIGSEVVAQQIAALPNAERRDAVLRSMEFFCMSDANEGHGSVNCRGTHPEQSLRVAGVYGANPSIRNLLGCRGESTRYKTCGASKSILESANTRSSTARPNERAAPAGTEDNRQNQNRGRNVR